MNTLIPPYYAVIFSSRLSEDMEGYEATAERMLQLAEQQAGFLGVDTVRNNRQGITVSYWKDEASILQWKQQSEHLQAQLRGKQQWYEQYSLQVSRVERSYHFEKE